MLLRLLLLFTIVPLVELTLLIWLAQKTTIGWTLGLVVATGVLGAALARHEGLRCWRRVGEEMDAGRLPGDALLDGLMILLAGALLVTPGVLTDLVGFALLVPMFRRILKRRLKSRLQARIGVFSPMAAGPPPTGWPTGQPTGHDEIIDSRVIDVPPEKPEENP